MKRSNADVISRILFLTIFLLIVIYALESCQYAYGATTYRTSLDFSDGAWAQVTVNRAYIKSRPVKSDIGYTYLRKSDYIRIDRVKNGYARIRCANTYAWISAKLIKFVEEGWVYYTSDKQWHYKLPRQKDIISNDMRSLIKTYWSTASKSKVLMISDSIKHKTYVYELYLLKWCPRYVIDGEVGSTIKIGR